MHETSHPPKITDHTPNERGLIEMPSADEFQRMAKDRLAREDIEKTTAKMQRNAWEKAYNRKQWKSRMKKVMATTALLATVKSGGFADMAADPFIDAEDVARDAIGAPAFDLPDELDGIKFEDYPAKAQAEFTEDETDRVEREAVARSTVVELFGRLDKEGYDGLVAEVRHDKLANPESYVTSERIEQANSEIEDAETNEDAIATLAGFVREYELEAGFHDGESFTDKQGELKQVLNSYVNVLSALPKDFVALSGLKRLTVSDSGVSSSAGPSGGSEAGTYSPDTAELNVVVRSKLVDAASKVEGVLQGDDYSYEAIIAHELGHALSKQLAVGAGSYLDEDQVVAFEDGMDGSALLNQVGRNIVNRPNYVSIYGRSSSSENIAEVLSGVLSDRSDGLALPDESRRFSSGANKMMISTLAALEAVRPGIAKILIANRLSE